ncbi:MAG: sigma 54-interacting transcriptional regulator [Desulfosarcina sp.]|nr:sigma 54-interacting transcriptional regulator [Desulfobacterales bacterium]
MPAKKIRIGIFASSQSLIERIQTIATAQHDHIYINTQGLDDAIAIGAEMERNGVEVIISRRGTAHLLRENLQIPVLSFPHRSLDILVSLQAAAQYGRRILLPAFRQEMSAITILEDLLDVELIQKIYQDKASLAEGISQAKQSGCDVVVGGSVTQQIALSCDLTFIEIKTSDEDIAATIENAKSVARSSREQKATGRRYRAIVDAASDGIIAVDERGHITACNAMASHLLLIGSDQAIGRHITHLIPDSPIPRVLRLKKPIQDRLAQIKQDQFIFNHLPVILEGQIIGAVSTFRDIGRVIRSEHVVRRSLSRGLVAKYDLDDLVHASSAMRDTVNLGREYARTESTILVMGETGTGKEIFAHGIHRLSRRAAHPFVSVNCAALPLQLLESELFGYVEGAFTGTKKGGKPGRFEIAHQGTIFLDEIDTTPAAVQIRLLRVLQEREVMRVGGDRQIPIDVRVVTAATRDLSAAVQEGKFRADLFFRLNVLRIQVPPLRERQEDIPLLIGHFIGLFSDRQTALEPIILPESYLDLLKRYDWPGNVRQLRNFAERIVMNCNLRCNHDMLDVLYQELVDYASAALPAATNPLPPMPLNSRMKQKTLQDERAIIMEALELARFQKGKAAESLGISRTTLWRKIKELDIN